MSSFFIAQHTTAQTVDATLIGAWSFDEGAGSTAADLSPTRSSGSLSGHTWEAGKQNSGICFGGVTGQHMTTASGSVENPQAVTLSGWVKPTLSEGTWGWIAGFGDSLGLYIDEDGGLVMYVWTGAGWSNVARAQTQLGLSEQGLQDSVWHHVAGSYDPQSGFGLYVDGKEIGTASAVGPINYGLGGDFRIGSMQGTRTFNGCLDEINLHEKALSFAEIQSSANVYVAAAPVASSECIDSDGDGWGWDGVKPCQINVATPIASSACIDSNGDGWGWDGEKTCQINGVSPIASNACVDDDGDGWGWDGEKTCQVNSTAPIVSNACIDSDGDGWGWDGEKPCQINVATPIASTACVDSNGDGWGWDGEKTCQINGATPVASTVCIDSNGDGWGWDGVQSCIPESLSGSQGSVAEPIVTPVDILVTGNVFVNSVDEFDLQWGGFPLIADISNKRLFLSLGEDFAASNALSAPLSYRHADSGYLIAVNGNQISAGSNLSLSVQHGDVLPVSISRNNSPFDQYQLVITNLPIVQIFANSIQDEPKLPGTIRWVDGALNTDTGTMPLGIEYRGNTAQRFEKKPFSIEVRDENGKGTNVQFLNLRSDDDWILDAAFRDQSFVRNLVSHDMFRDMRSYAYINSEGEKKGQSAIAGGLTELILNSEYHGVFVLHEKVDRKLLKLEKIDVPEDASGDRWDLVDFTDPANGSVLYKASEEQANFQSAFGIESEFEQKYPDDDDITHYQPLRDLGEFIANSTDSDFNNRAASIIEFESVVDWWLMRLATSNWDAFHKNYYPARSENLKWTIVPWDFDATFGMDWRGGVDPASVEFYDPARNKLVGRLIENPQNGFNAMAKARWSELRQSIFTADAIASRFAFYANQVDRGINVSGVSPRQRNTQRWPNTGNTGAGSPELADVEYIRDWLVMRLAFVDLKMDALER